MSALQKITSASVETEATDVIYHGIFDGFTVIHPNEDDRHKPHLLNLDRKQARELFNALGVMLRESAKWNG